MGVKGQPFEHIIKSVWPLKPAAYPQFEVRCTCGRRTWQRVGTPVMACTTCAGEQRATGRVAPGSLNLEKVYREQFPDKGVVIGYGKDEDSNNGSGTE